MTCQNCLPVCWIFPATFTLHLAHISLVDCCRLFFAYFGFSLILKGFNIGHDTISKLYVAKSLVKYREMVDTENLVT